MERTNIYLKSAVFASLTRREGNKTRLEVLLAYKEITNLPSAPLKSLLPGALYFLPSLFNTRAPLRSTLEKDALIQHNLSLVEFRRFASSTSKLNPDYVEYSRPLCVH